MTHPVLASVAVALQERGHLRRYAFFRQVYDSSSFLEWVPFELYSSY